MTTDDGRRARFEAFVRDVQDVCRRHRLKIAGTSISEGVAAEIMILDGGDEYDFTLAYLDQWNEIGTGIADDCIAGICAEEDVQ